MAQDALERRTRLQILDVALGLFARQGFEATSVDSIARGADSGLRTVLWHFGDKARLYADAVELAGDRFLHAMRGHLESRRPTLSETLAEWVWTLEKGGDVSALVYAASGTDWDPGTAGALESLNDRLVDFWQRRIAMVCYPPDTRPLRCKELAHLVVAAAPAFALARGDAAVVRSALMADFAMALECLALDDGPKVIPAHSNGTCLEGADGDDPAWFSPRELQVLREVEKGITNKQIAIALATTEHTVKYHLKNVFRKLSVRRRTDALKVAKALRLI